MDPLCIDLYEGDIRSPRWDFLMADQRFNFAVIKASEGNYYTPEWFRVNWLNLKNPTNRTRGKDFFRGAYHYLKFDTPGDVQAKIFISQLNAAGGLEPNDLWPVVDVEEGGDRSSNRHATKQQVIDCTSKFAETIKSITGRKTMLYAGSMLRDLEITDRMGCSYLWTARYTATLPSWVYTSVGWDLASLWAWQYCGDGVSYLANYPAVGPLGKTDLSAVVMGLDKTKANL